jgi:hypothetical protein
LTSKNVFERYIGIDYSGAGTPTSSLKGLRVYMADRNSSPTEIQPPRGPKKYWTRRGIAEWLVDMLSEDIPTLVGIDHGFSFPIRYFTEHQLDPDWRAFLEDFQFHWPTDQDQTYVDFVREGVCGDAAARSGNARWRRVTEIRARGAKSVFHFDVQGSVAKSTHSGLPWLRYIDLNTFGRTHFWPFDGWEFPVSKSVVVEVYPALWSRGYAQEGSDGDQHDAFAIAAWMRQTDSSGLLATFTKPSLNDSDLQAAKVEGWILGVL